MDADELRRIAREAPLRNAQEEAQAEAMKRKQRRDQLYEEEWRLARQAVADLDENIRKAADEGKYETVVYRAWANGILIIEHSPKYSWWDGFLKSEQFKYSVPDYAKFVFDHCPSALHPRWAGRHRYVASGPASDGYVYSRTYLDLCNGLCIELHVGW